MLEVEKFAAAGRLAATIAHEVNNPMEAIKNAIWLLQESVAPEAQSVYEILKSETERVARIVRQMLGLYRNNEQVKPVNINTIIEDTMLLLNRQLQRSNVDRADGTGIAAGCGAGRRPAATGALEPDHQCARRDGRGRALAGAHAACEARRRGTRHRAHPDRRYRLRDSRATC